MCPPSATANMGVLALERLLGGPSDWSGLAEDLAKHWPDAPVGEMILALMSASRSIEKNFRVGGPAHEGAVHGYRLAGLLGMDLYALQVVGITAPLGRDLTAWWHVETSAASAQRTTAREAG